jgi:histone H3/H4
MENEIAKTSLIRIARQAGVVSVAEGSIPRMKEIINTMLSDVISKAIVCNNEGKTKTLSHKDLLLALSLSGVDLTALS